MIPTRQRIDVGDSASISCNVVHGFPVRKLVWLFNGQQIHVENIESTSTQLTNNGSKTTYYDKNTKRLSQELSPSFRSLSSSSTTLPFMSTSTHPRSFTLGSAENKRKAGRLFLDKGKVCSA